MQGLVERKCCDNSGPEKDEERAHRELVVVHINHLMGVEKYMPKEN